MASASTPPIETTVDMAARVAAREAGLVYVSPDRPGYARLRKGKGFAYKAPDGKPVTDAGELARIKKLGIPPAYNQVWICAKPNGHLQATGVDAKGRRQYRYHADWQAVRDTTKYARMLEFAKGLPALRARVDADMAKKGLPREKVLATLVHLLETTLIRVGNEAYARENRSYGLTTLRDRHVVAGTGTLKFAFKGKSGKEWQLKVSDRRVARVVKACQDLPGQQLFQYVDEDGTRHGVDSGEVNDYLREISGADISAKDFRTWAGTVLAAVALQEVEAFDSDTAAKRNIKAAVTQVAQKLGNTPTICRKCYIHPEVFAAYLDKSLFDPALVKELNREVKRLLSKELQGLRSEEALVLVLLQQRLAAAA